jgi:hypothetical protein
MALTTLVLLTGRYMTAMKEPIFGLKKLEPNRKASEINLDFSIVAVNRREAGPVNGPLSAPAFRSAYSYRRTAR